MAKFMFGVEKWDKSGNKVLEYVAGDIQAKDYKTARDKLKKRYPKYSVNLLVDYSEVVRIYG